MRERFVDTFHCRSRAHCRHCRALEAGRPWRQSLAARFTLPADAPDWTCPEGLPWNVAENEVPAEVRPPEKKPCGCGKNHVAAVSRDEPDGSGAVAAGEPSPTRPSCLKCVEKHLGAAWVLISEHQNGYPHRLLAIGHLHEAEEESQAWPKLHVAIREARKVYQRTGTAPDFPGLVILLMPLDPLSGFHGGKLP